MSKTATETIMAFKHIKRIMTAPKMPARLLRLNQDLAADKRLDHVYATRGEIRIRVMVERCDEVPRKYISKRDYRATAAFDGRAYTAYGTFPSVAFMILTREISEAIDAKLSKNNVVSLPDRQAA